MLYVPLALGSMLLQQFPSRPAPPLQILRVASPTVMVSERHNQAYKETIKLFEPISRDVAMPDFTADERVSYGAVMPAGDASVQPLQLVHQSAVPLFSAEECAAVVSESESVSVQMGGWTSQRHFNHPTTDIPMARLPRTRKWLNTALQDRIYPFLGSCFEDALPDKRALRVADAFVVKYNASGGQTFLSPHRDGSVLSFNVALNDIEEYEGGGTWFEGLGRSLAIERGHVCAHASGVFHGGHPITHGVRYILVGFVIVEGYQNWAMRFMKAVWNY